MHTTRHIYQNLIPDKQDFSMFCINSFIWLNRGQILIGIGVYVWEGLIQNTDLLERDKFTLGLLHRYLLPKVFVDAAGGETSYFLFTLARAGVTIPECMALGIHHCVSQLLS